MRVAVAVVLSGTLIAGAGIGAAGGPQRAHAALGDPTRLSVAAPIALASQGDPVVAAAGDIACDPKSSNFKGGNGSSNSCRQKAVSDLLVNAGLSAVLLLGDNQYYCGGYDAFLQSYDPSWGRVKNITFPSVGNHEYLDSPAADRTGCDSSNTGAAGYYRYFGAAAGDPAKGYYSYNIGTWHVIVLNSSCSKAGGCSASTPQGKWLRADLAAHSNYCTMAYWHIPLFSSGGRASSTYKTFWDALYEADADLVLGGHDHTYERFAPQTPSGTKDTVRGIRQFVVGTGGANHTTFPGVFPNSEVRDSTTFGVLKLTLHPTSYDWQFVPEAGKTFTDSGSQACHGQSADTEPPTTPTGLTATATSSSRVSLSWTPSTDNVGVVGYDVLRGGAPIGSSVGSSFTDDTVAPATSYSYTVRARDAGGNQSGLSSAATVTTPSAPPASTFTFTPTADTYVRSDQPSSNFGSSTHVDVDGSPLKNILLRFTVTGVGTNAATGASLRLHAVDPSPSGGIVKPTTGGSWSEGNVTWSTRPTAAAGTLATLGAVSAGSWYEVDLSSWVTGDGTYDLVIESTHSNGADYASKERASNLAPQLVVTK